MLLYYIETETIEIGRALEFSTDAAFMEYWRPHNIVTNLLDQQRYC